MLMKQGIVEYLAHVESGGRTTATIKSYAKTLELFLKRQTDIRNAPVYVEDFSAFEIEEYINLVRQEMNYSTSSLYNTLTALRCFYDYAVKREWIDHNVAREVKQVRRKFKERTYLTEPEVEKALDMIIHPVVQAAAYTLYYAGLRNQECVDLEIGDVDFQKNIIHVRLGKGAKSRKIPMCTKLAGKLKEYVKQRPADSEMLFACMTSGRISKSFINRELKIAAAEAGLGIPLSAHMLRHSFASNLLKNGVDIVRVQRLMGHTYLQTTAIYLHTNMDGLMDAVEVL